MPPSTPARPAQRRRRVFVMPFNIAILLCVSFVLLFVLAVIAANTTWKDYQASLPDWPKTTCKLSEEDPETSVDECGSSAFSATIFLDSIAKVENTIHDFEPDTIDGRTVAFESSQRCTYDTRDEAEDFAQRFENRKGQDVDCYTNGERIRLTPGGFDDSERLMLRIRAIFAIIAAIVAGLAVLYAAHHFRAVTTFTSRQPPQPPNISRVTRAARAPQHYRRPLSVDDTHMLVSSLPEGHDGGTCPICLEEFSDDSRKARTLPCGHAYHEECALQWFRKGHASCPYCNHDLGDEVQRLREENDQHVTQLPIDESSGSSGGLDRNSWNGRWDRRGRRERVDTGS